MSMAAMTLLAAVTAGCGSRWKREVIYSREGLSLYRESQLDGEGKKTPLGYRHPFDVPREKAAILFSQLVYKVNYLLKKDEDRNVFTPTEVENLAEAVSIATSILSPDERLRFLLTRSNWTDLALGTTGTAGVIFSPEEGVVSVAFDIIQEKISGGDDGDPKNVVFRIDPVEYDDADPVYPAEGMKTHVSADGRTFARWLDVKLADVKSRVPTPVAASPAPAGQAPAAGNAAAAPVPAAAPQDSEARYRRVRERLETLKRLRADGALTEEEYQKEYSRALSEL